MILEKTRTLMLGGMMMLGCLSATAQKQWTLQECIDYAKANNISLQKAGLQRQSACEDVAQSQAAMLPSLSFSTNQQIGYQPWPETGTYSVQGSHIESQVNKTTYNGSYSVSGNWTVWNGNRNKNQVKLNQIAVQKDAVDSITTALNLEEQIVQLYIQILYTKENIKVLQNTVETAKVTENRGIEMQKNGKMSKADVAQLTSQRAQDEYNVVQAESQTRNYKRQLKQLLQITDDTEFDVAPVEATDQMALAEIPALQTVYQKACESRPELKSAQLAIESSEMSKTIAKAQNLPTVSVNASAGTNTNSQNTNNIFKQMKYNFDVAAGVGVQIPILDQRQKKTAVNKAEIQRQSALLDLQDKKTSLYSTIESYWIQAENNRAQFKSAKVSTESAETSYELLSEQFKVGLKNVVELQEGKTRLLTAQQSELQSKYLTIFNIKMLEFYGK